MIGWGLEDHGFDAVEGDNGGAATLFVVLFAVEQHFQNRTDRPGLVDGALPFLRVLPVKNFRDAKDAIVVVKMLFQGFQQPQRFFSAFSVQLWTFR